MLDATYFGLTASDWRTAAIVVSIFAALGILSAIGELRLRRRARRPAGDIVQPRR